MTLEMWFVVAMIAIPLLQVVFNRWRVDVAALFVIVALGLAQYLGFSILGDEKSPQQTLLAISGFSQPVVVTLIGLFILTQTLSHNGVMLWLGQRLAAMGGKSESRLIFLFTFASASLSLLMNNVAVGALLLPSAIQVAKKSKIAPSKLLIPISFGTALGGMATYFTTANIVLSNLLSVAKPPQLPLGVLSFFPVGGLIAIAGILYLTTIGRRILPNREPGPEQAIARRASDEVETLYSLGERLWEASLTPDCSLIGKTLKQTRIGERFGLAVIAIRRGRGIIVTPDPTVEIEAHDVLLVVGRKERVDQLSEIGFKISRELQTLTNFNVAFLELILAPHSAYVGQTIKQMNFRRKYGFMVVALFRRDRSYRTDVGDIPLEMGDSLLLIGPPERTRDLRINPDIVILETDPTPRAIPRRRALISVAVFVSAIAFSVAGVPVYLSVLAAALLSILLRLLPLQEVYRSIEWQVIFFIAGMYVASLGMIHTGLANLIGLNVITLITNLGIGPLGLAATTFLLSALLTQFMGSQATAFVIGPIAISAALHLNTNPQAIAIAAAIGCSASFLTPIAHPVNLIMMGPGNYRFSDFFRVGLGLMIVVFLMLIAGLLLFWRL
ncbi:MAG: SLC13 family permease [Anaerolineales bacterium]|nr:SLC13 family permease [Anaerolineales bacterium]